MSPALRAGLSRLLAALARRLGSRITDQRTGEPLGTAFLVPWRGRILVIGYTGRHAILPAFVPQERLTYWKQEIGFASHPLPDFPRERDTPRPS